VRYITEVVVRKAAAHLCLTLNIIDLKFSVEHDRVETTLNIIFCVLGLWILCGRDTSMSIFDVFSHEFVRESLYPLDCILECFKLILHPQPGGNEKK
jgi:hypothetical protein